MSESEIMKSISDHNFDVAKAVYKGFSNEVIDDIEKDFYYNTYLGKDFYADDDFNIKVIKFRKTVTYQDKLIDISVKHSTNNPLNILSPDSIDCNSLQKSLEEIFEKDQESRVSGINIKVIDSINRIKGTAILEKCGIPKKKNVGLKAVLGIYVVVQHAPKEILAYYYPQFYLAAQEDNIPMAALATMQDRILVQNGYDQVFGTQRAAIGEYKIQDPENVNIRREKMGLAPM